MLLYNKLFVFATYCVLLFQQIRRYTKEKVVFFLPKRRKYNFISFELYIFINWNVPCVIRKVTITLIKIVKIPELITFLNLNFECIVSMSEAASTILFNPIDCILTAKSIKCNQLQNSNPSNQSYIYDTMFF